MTKQEYRVFILTMPQNNAWNGKWTGDGELFCKVNKYKPDAPVLKNVDRSDSHFYNFGDGWAASIETKKITSNEAAKYRRISKGFCNYEWMIDEIEQHGSILSISERKTTRQ